MTVVFLVGLVVVVAASVPLLGGRLSALADLRLRWWPLLTYALAVQVVIVSVAPGGPDGLYRVLHVSTYAAAGAFLWANRRVVGLWLVALGAASNLLVISLNGGVMPASAAALRAADRTAVHGQFTNSTTVAHARLSFLGDVFHLPGWFPLHNVFSVGDVAIAVGVALALYWACGVRRRGRPARAHKPSAA